ncbi:MAG: hypothetical protein AAF715_19235 [Myxococcota bacterium]
MNKAMVRVGLVAIASVLAVGCGDDDDPMPTGSGGSGGATSTTTTSTTSAGGNGQGGSGAGGMAAMPRGENNPPTPGTQIDRTGRPAISTALIEAFNPDAATANATKDAYNQAGPDDWSSFADEIEFSLAVLDGLDEDCGNQLVADQDPADRYSFLAGVLADDQLYVLSSSGTCGTYLGLEAEIVGAVPAGAGGCGGRTPADDVIERSYSVLALGALNGFDDTIAADDGVQTDTFPFLGAPL